MMIPTRQILAFSPYIPKVYTWYSHVVLLAEEEDDFDFTEHFTNLKAEFKAQLKEEAKRNQRIVANLSKIKMP